MDTLKAWAEEWARNHSMNYPESHDATWYAKRRELLKQQSLLMLRLERETAGQLTLPMFGDNSPKIQPTSEASLTLRGMHVVERKA